MKTYATFKAFTAISLISERYWFAILLAHPVALTNVIMMTNGYQTYTSSYIWIYISIYFIIPTLFQICVHAHSET